MPQTAAATKATTTKKSRKKVDKETKPLAESDNVVKVGKRAPRAKQVEQSDEKESEPLTENDNAHNVVKAGKRAPKGKQVEVTDKTETEPLAESENVKAGKRAPKGKQGSEKAEELPGTSKAKKKGTEAATGQSKKVKKDAPEPPAEDENVVSSRTRGPKAKKNYAEEPDESEEPEVNKPKKKAAAAKRTKKETTETVPENDEVQLEAPAKKVRKRKADKNEESAEGESSKKNKAAGPSNATATKWETINFSCTSKTSDGKPSNFHITSWNVDGIRAWIKKGGLNILEYDQPDILCLQETKCSDDKLPEELKDIGEYESYWCSSEKEGYAGVGVLTKTKPINVVYGIESEDHDDEGRCITAEFEGFYLVNVYVPNAGKKLVTLPKRLEWNKSFKNFIKKLDANKPVIVCGDMNVAHTEIDLANPKTNTKNAGFTIEEREGMTDFLQDGYIDTFRQLYPDKEKAYTFWTYMANARSKNIGWRLDYFIISERFMGNVCDNIILHEVLGSDHCPVALHLNL